jgi:hypothetical protein
MLTSLANILESKSNRVKSTGLLFGDFTGDEHSKITNNARIESFGLHMRDLLDFFYFRRYLPTTETNNVHAEDFFENEPAKWDYYRPDYVFITPQEFFNLRSRIRQQIGHITVDTTTLSPLDKSWDFYEQTQKIAPAYQKFSSHSPRELLGSFWKRAQS